MNPISFENQVVVITGAGNGLGKSYALEIASRGGAIVVNDLGGAVDGTGISRCAADDVVREIRTRGARAVASYDSVTSAAGGRNIIASAMDHFSRIDALISNAGNLRNAMLADITDEILDATLDVHLKGAFNVLRPVFPIMRQQGYGRILLASSAAGLFGNPTQAAYGAAKAGLVGLMNVVALEGRDRGVLANALLPAARTRMSGQMDPKLLETLTAATAAFASTSSPEFVIPLVTYLVSQNCRTSHAIYSAAGGRFARVFIGVTEGWQGPRDKPATAEAVASHFDEVEDRTHWVEPDDLTDEYKKITAAARRV
jgi:NAD(P)-dependent dehydrogenase (short-subunit alcohol dehydrogenase family)